MIKIVYEDKYLLAIDKPSGLVVHSDGRTEENSLVDWIKENYPKLENIGNPHTLDSGRYAKRWGIINRLDRDTSGLILIAKNEEVFLNLQKQFMEREVEKEYLAVVWGFVRPQAGQTGNMECTPGQVQKFSITEPISRHKKDPRIWVCGTGVGERNSKRDAETVVEILKSLQPPLDKGGVNSTTLLKLFPKTGRTHQLRLHCRFIGHPIVGDKKYGINGMVNEHGVEQLKNLPHQNEGESRLMLHAKSLEFVHPETALKIKVETELPVDFKLI